MFTLNRNIVFLCSVLAMLFFSIKVVAQEQPSVSNNSTGTLYFYGPIVDAKDETKIQLSTDLFFSQFQLESDFTIIDRRTTVFSLDMLETHVGTNDLIFYNEIREDDNKWYVSLFLIDLQTKREVTVKHIYDEYYRILIDAKDVLSELLVMFSSPNGQNIETVEDTSANTSASVTIASLFGTWKGEEYVDKIVILRGGKGFVIFENGASMNIIVAIEGSVVTATQDSKSNASFFPELPREVALVKALDVDPIEWELQIENEDSLVGIKHTYVSTESNGQTDVVKAEIPVKWYR